ncbi:MAG: 4Fe-4S dicluster domain-containing protein [Oscillospiraceae bacterium]|nr:4Fe-4S dicluster domain-containing protein [Oscillospiraceae bacterium]
MRGIDSPKSTLRTRVFTEVARLAYEGWDAEKFQNLPYKIIPGDEAQYRDSVFVERAIVAERLRAAMGLSLRRFQEYSSALSGVDASLIDEKYYEPPLIDIIKFACNRCPENRVVITNACQHCLEHPCQEVCPKEAISFQAGISHIDESKCIKCGKCINVCSYHAIIRLERPCAKACGMNAIKTDSHGRASIDHDKCVSCGMCLVNCPFGAIIDKSQIFQTITAVKSGVPVYAAIAPAFAGQFGNVSSGQVRAAFKKLGFADVVEVAIGADLCTVEEAKDFLAEVPANQPFMATSCCPAWSVMAKKLFPEFAPYISMALTPMVLTGRLIKKQHPDCKVVFVGPCAAKKLEASRRTIRSDVDFVLTFEEFSSILEAQEIDISALEPDEPMEAATRDGVGFAVSGGVAQAVENVIHAMDPEREVLIARAEGLVDCRKMLALAKAKKYNGYLLEGMACPGGCVAGAGVIAPVKNSSAAVNKRVKDCEETTALSSEYLEYLELIEKEV